MGNSTPGEPASVAAKTSDLSGIKEFPAAILKRVGLCWVCGRPILKSDTAWLHIKASRTTHEVVPGRDMDIVAFNDSHSHAEVMAAFDHALRLRERE